MRARGPVAGGERDTPVLRVGGGSSDAATVLLGLNGLWCLGLSLGRLKAVGAQLGSDVPFFLHGGVALVEGRGEIVCPFDSRDRAEFWAVLLVPDPPSIPGKTQALYNSLEQASFTRGESSWRLAEELIRTGAVEPSLLFNVFESVAWDVFPGLDGCRELFQECGASSVHLAGSGPVLFTLLGDRDRAEAICGSLRMEGMEAHAVQALGRDHV